jgi:hypothetical protein
MDILGDSHTNNLFATPFSTAHSQHAPPTQAPSHITTTTGTITSTPPLCGSNINGDVNIKHDRASQFMVSDDQVVPYASELRRFAAKREDYDGKYPFTDVP